MKPLYKYFIFIFFVFIGHFVSSQPVIQWAKCYGSHGSESPHSVIQTSDDGFLIVGNSNGNGNDVSGVHGSLLDAWVVKIDSIGTLEWQKCLGGTWFDGGIKAIETISGYVIACNGGSFDGDQTGNHGDGDYWIVKLDLSGNLVWEYSYGGDQSDEVYGLSATPDGGIVISGRTESVNSGNVQGSYYSGGIVGDAWVIKLDSSGILQWQKCVGGTGTESYGDMVVDAIGNIYIIPSTNSLDGDATCINNMISGGWLVKLDSTGRVLWDKCYGGSGGGILYSISIKDDKLLMAGMTTSSDGDLSHLYGYTDAWILVTDTAGNRVFSQSYGGSLTDEFNDAKFTFDNKIIAGGETNSNDHDVTLNHTASDCWLVCVDMAGNLLWQNTYGGSGQDGIQSVLPLENGKVAFAAYTATYNNGDVAGSYWPNDIWFVVLDILNNVSPIQNKSKANLMAYPNPFNSIFELNYSVYSDENISINLFNVYGQKITEIVNEVFLIKGKYNVQVNLPNLNSGVYYLVMHTGDKNYSTKVVKL